MNLSLNLISKIKQKISIDENKFIIRLDTSADQNMSPEEYSSNIYCIDSRYEILWQINEEKRSFEDDRFVYIGKNAKGEIIGYRFSGFEYKIDPATGEAKCIGFNKG